MNDPCDGDLKPSGGGSRVLEIRDLSVSLHRKGTALMILHDVSLDVHRGEIVALVGESGSGKSTLGLTIQGLLPAESDPIISGSVRVHGVEMANASSKVKQRVRREYLGAIFQDPMTSLNPSMRVGQQLSENTFDDTPPEVWLSRVGISAPEDRMGSYPHQLSGGERQRTMIAIAMASHPDLVIADEPTTALDVTVQAHILQLVRELSKKENTAFLFVTHDLSVAAAIADRIVVLYAGRVIEVGPVPELLIHPAHPYTAALLEARFDLHVDKRYVLPTLSGLPPSPDRASSGCPFETRCLIALESCREASPLLSPVPQHPGAAACFRVSTTSADLWAEQADEWSGPRVEKRRTLLEVSDVYKSYRMKRFLEPDHVVHALQGIGFRVTEGESVAFVGESGSGKSTILRLVAGLVPPDEGEIILNVSETPQMVFQDAVASLTPWLSVSELIGERLRGLGLNRAERRVQVLEALDLVGLPPELASAKPSQLSVGQCQRVALSRAVVIPPELLLCDEPASAVDVSLAASILNLLRSLRHRLGMALLFVTHDLAAARFIADRILVLKDGRIVEAGSAGEIVRAPSHPYTQNLLLSMPENLLGELA